MDTGGVHFDPNFAIRERSVIVSKIIFDRHFGLLSVLIAFSIPIAYPKLKDFKIIHYSIRRSRLLKETESPFYTQF